MSLVRSCLIVKIRLIMERNSLESVKLGKREREGGEGGGERGGGEGERERGGGGREREREGGEREREKERYQFTLRKISLSPFRIHEVTRSLFLEIDKQEIKLDDFVSKYTHNMYMYTIIILIL